MGSVDKSPKKLGCKLHLLSGGERGKERRKSRMQERFRTRGKAVTGKNDHHAKDQTLKKMRGKAEKEKILYKKKSKLLPVTSANRETLRKSGS